MRSVQNLLSAAAHTIRDVRAAVPKREPISLGKEAAIPTGGIQLVQVKKVSGAGGDDETLPTWVYDAWPYGADTSDDDLRCIVAGVVLYRRIEFGLMTYAPDDSIGYAFRDTDGVLNLLEVPGEVVPVGPCEGST